MNDDSTSLTFEEALAELEGIVQKLEAGDVSLDEAINAYSRGIELKNKCQQRLEAARLKVEKIQFSSENLSPTIQPFDNE